MKILASLVLLLISSTAFAATSESYGKGGWYKDFQPEIERANASGELFRIMLSAYNAALRQYVLANGYMDTLAFHTIPGAVIIDKFGYRECPKG